MFQSTYLYKVRLMAKIAKDHLFGFQSTYLYKVRHFRPKHIVCYGLFQSTYLYKVRLYPCVMQMSYRGFNPRTYIRYDDNTHSSQFNKVFQSTYLYKVRPCLSSQTSMIYMFQSTYLYKVRPIFPS